MEPQLCGPCADHRGRDGGCGAAAGFYEKAGVLRDVVQNHLLQLLTLVALELPAAFNAKFLRDEKVKVLQAISRCAPRIYRQTRCVGNTAPIATNRA